MNCSNVINPSSTELSLIPSSSPILVKPKKNAWNRISTSRDVQYNICLFLHLRELASFETSVKMEYDLKELIWKYHRKREYKEYEWRDCTESKMKSKHKANFLLSHYLELLISSYITKKELTKSEEDYVKYLAYHFPQFGYVVRRRSISHINHLRNCITSCFACCTSLSASDKLRVSILNEKQYGGTLLLSKFLLLIENRVEVKDIFDLKHCEQLVELKVTCIHLFNHSLKQEEQESLAIAVAQQKDFRALDFFLNKLSQNFYLAMKYQNLLEKYKDSGLAPILYHRSLMLGNTNSKMSEYLMINSLKNYQDGCIDRSPADALLHLGSIQIELDKYQEADELYSRLIQRGDNIDPELAKISNFFINRALAKSSVGAPEETCSLLIQAFEKSSMATLMQYLIQHIESKLERYEKIDKLLDQVIEKRIVGASNSDLLVKLIRYKFKLFKLFGKSKSDKIETLSKLCDQVIRLHNRGCLALPIDLCILGDIKHCLAEFEKNVKISNI